MTKLTDEDKALFANATQNVDRLKTNKIVPKSKPNKRIKIRPKVATDILIDKQFTDSNLKPVSAHQSLFFQQPGVRKQDITKLKKGLFSLDITHDIHGKTEVIAEDSIHHFIHEAIQHRCKYGLLVHGKGYNSDIEQPILKNLVNQVLNHHPYILAYCSSQPKDGGTGAVYILFKTKQY